MFYVVESQVFLKESNIDRQRGLLGFTCNKLNGMIKNYFKLVDYSISFATELLWLASKIHAKR